MHNNSSQNLKALFCIILKSNDLVLRTINIFLPLSYFGSLKKYAFQLVKMHNNSSQNPSIYFCFEEDEMKKMIDLFLRSKFLCTLPAKFELQPTGRCITEIEKVDSTLSST